MFTVIILQNNIPYIFLEISQSHASSLCLPIAAGEFVAGQPLIIIDWDTYMSVFYNIGRNPKPDYV
jgi:hypothetical protein